jgi:metal-sulfur cluster biosynthetic enzyme
MSELASNREAGSAATSTDASARAAGDVGPSREQVLDALSAVYDPELDEPITSLRFVSRCEVSADGDVEVLLRLPTPQCAPNFAFLMGADARSAIHGVPGVRSVQVSLEDHYTGEEINAALRRGDGFTGAFPGETEDDDLEALRELFVRKALIARQAAVCEALLDGGADAEDVLARRVADLPDTPAARRSLQLRAALKIPSGPREPAFVLADGRALAPAELSRWLRMARLVRTGLDANGGICRDLLRVRYPDIETQESAP